MSAGFGEFNTMCHDGRQRHEWQPPHTHNRCCVHCGTLATEFFDAATKARTEFAGTVRAPASAHGTPKKK